MASGVETPVMSESRAGAPGLELGVGTTELIAVKEGTQGDIARAHDTNPGRSCVMRHGETADSHCVYHVKMTLDVPTVEDGYLWMNLIGITAMKIMRQKHKSVTFKG